LQSLPEGSARDSAIGAFVESVDGYDIRVATEWASRINDDEKRLKFVEAATSRWLRENPSAAQAWLEGAAVPDDFKKRVLDSK
jgi:hypothetical protein